MAKQIQKHPLIAQIEELCIQKREEFCSVLPDHMDFDRFMRMALNAINVNKELLECSRPSLAISFMNAAQTGLDPDPNLGQVYFVPRKNKGVKECTFMVGYRGFCELAYRSHRVISISSNVVHHDDEFDYCFGTEDRLEHKPCGKPEKGPIIYVWAMAKMVERVREFVVLSIDQVEAIAKKSPSYTNKWSPWNNFRESMIKKTAVRQLCKLLPVSIPMQRAITLDEATEIPDRESTPDKLEDALEKKLKPAEVAGDDLSFKGEIPGGD